MRSFLAAGAALLAALAIAACGGGDSAPAPQQGVAGPQIPQDLRLVNCTDWREASVEERFGTVGALEDFAGGPTGGPGRGAVLDDEEAYSLLDGWCENGYARAFKLYKLYTRAAAFVGH